MASKQDKSLAKVAKAVTREIRSTMRSGYAAALSGVSSDIYSPYEFKFRASRLPFCPREFVLDQRFPYEVMREESYDFSFYVGIGTAIHEVIQQYLGLSKSIYGHWKCCGVIEKFRTGSASCLVCGRPQKYEEFEIDSELGAHVDAVFLQHSAVGEFKSTSGTNLPKLTGPYPKHLEQASAYTNALNEQFGWELDKIIFVYLSRDRPSDFRVFVVPPIPDAFSGALKKYAQAKEQLVSGEIPDPTCKSSSEGVWKGCTYAGVCFHPHLEEILLPVSSIVR